MIDAQGAVDHAAQPHNEEQAPASSGCTAEPAERRDDERCARRYVADERSLSSKPAPQQQPVDEGARRHCQRVTCRSAGL